MRSRLRLALFATIAISAHACAATSAPSTSSASITSQPANQTPSPSVVPSTSATPLKSSVQPSSATQNLAGLLPTEVGGTTLKVSNDDTQFTPDPNSDLGRLLSAVGASGADIRMASAYDPSGGSPLEIIALSFNGVTGTQLVAALDAVYGADPGRQVRKLDVSGTNVLVPANAGSATSAYVFVDGDVLFVVQAPNDEEGTEAVVAIIR